MHQYKNTSIPKISPQTIRFNKQKLVFKNSAQKYSIRFQSDHFCMCFWHSGPPETI